MKWGGGCLPVGGKEARRPETHTPGAHLASPISLMCVLLLLGGNQEEPTPANTVELGWTRNVPNVRSEKERRRKVFLQGSGFIPSWRPVGVKHVEPIKPDSQAEIGERIDGQ